MTASSLRRDVPVLILAAVVGLLLVQANHKALRPQGYDFSAYYAGARALMHGQNPYSATADATFRYIYPLTLAFVLFPLALLPYDAACVVWFFINLTFLVAAGKLVFQLLDENELPIADGNRSMAVFVFVGLMFGRPRLARAQPVCFRSSVWPSSPPSPS